MTGTLVQSSGVLERFADPDYALPATLEASTPPERRHPGASRHDVRLVVARAGCADVDEHPFFDLVRLLGVGDVLVVNTSATIPAAIDTVDAEGRPGRLHLSTRLASDGLWTAELRVPDGPISHPGPFGGPASTGERLALAGGGSAVLLEPSGASGRMWVARISVPGTLEEYLESFGMPIRYGYVAEAWPQSDYQTVFATVAGSAEMPSAARPFSTELVTALVSSGVEIVPLVLHTGVSSLEAPVAGSPAAEWFSIPFDSARRVNAARAAGARVVAVGTTVVRALESAVDRTGTVHPAQGYTDLYVTPDHELRMVDALLTGWHAPRTTHLDMLEAVAGRRTLAASYLYALDQGLLWHEFGDSHLILR